MFYLEFLNERGNWSVECRSQQFDNLKVSINELLFNGYTIRVVFREE